MNTLKTSLECLSRASLFWMRDEMEWRREGGGGGEQAENENGRMEMEWEERVEEKRSEYEERLKIRD